LARAVKDSIEKNEPETGLDRLHTYVVKLVGTLAARRGVTIDKDKPLHRVFGEYVKRLRAAGLIESEMTERILKSSISILESFNTVRNTRSLAHDNGSTPRLRAKLDTISLDEHADWLAEAILDSARCDSLRLACSALALKREKEVQTRYGKEKESWRDRLVRAIEEKVLTPKAVFLEVLTREQGWHHAREGTPLRERLLEDLEIDMEKIEKGVQI
jgi:hypothetical protein